MAMRIFNCSYDQYSAADDVAEKDVREPDTSLVNALTETGAMTSSTAQRLPTTSWKTGDTSELQRSCSNRVTAKSSLAAELEVEHKSNAIDNFHYISVNRCLEITVGSSTSSTD
jgi:hypothetical protein